MSARFGIRSRRMAAKPRRFGVAAWSRCGSSGRAPFRPRRLPAPRTRPSDARRMCSPEWSRMPSGRSGKRSGSCRWIARARVCAPGPVVITRGLLNSSLVHPREVFHAAIEAHAAGIILVHNHPSGDPTPSAEDRARDPSAG